MRPRKSLARDLAVFRLGLVSFDEFARDTAEVWRKLAEYTLRRWPGQYAVDEQDLDQEILLAVWRAVQVWDPERGVSLERFVWYQAGLAGQKAMKRALRYRKGRGAVWTLPLPKREPSEPASQARVAVARDHLRKWQGRGGIEEEVASALLDGRSLEDVARDVYADPVSRWEYWLGSEAEATARVRAAARRIGTRAARAV